MKKAKGDGPAPRGSLDDDEEYSQEDSEEEHTDVAVSSEDEKTVDEDYKQGLADALKNTGKSLKRGKTMAVREAIAAAKKYEIDASVVAEAEKRLEEHKKQQRREEVEKQVTALFDSNEVKDRAAVESMLKKATDADCKKEVISKLQDQLDEIIITRDLEEEEKEKCKEWLIESCREFVLGCTKPGGRPVLALDLSSGAKTTCRLMVDPPLQNLCLRDADAAETEFQQVPISSLGAMPAKDHSATSKSAGFPELKDGESDCAVAVTYEAEGKGSWCFIEPTLEQRDRFIEAIVVLVSISA